jgi:hypothetical protein
MGSIQGTAVSLVRHSLGEGGSPPPKTGGLEAAPLWGQPSAPRGRAPRHLEENPGVNFVTEQWQNISRQVCRSGLGKPARRSDSGLQMVRIMNRSSGPL